MDLIKVAIYFVLVISVVKGIKQKLISILDCDLPEDSYDEEHRIPHVIGLTKFRGQSFITYEFSVQKPTPPISISFRVYKFVTPKWELELKLQGLSCRSPIVAMALGKLKLVHDTTDCTVSVGNYSMDRFNFNDFFPIYQHLVQKSEHYRIHFEMSSPKGVMGCVALTIVILR